MFRTDTARGVKENLDTGVEIEASGNHFEKRSDWAKKFLEGYSPICVLLLNEGD
jgi:hypothetical protein